MHAFDSQTDGQKGFGNTVRCITCSRAVNIDRFLTKLLKKNKKKDDDFMNHSVYSARLQRNEVHFENFRLRKFEYHLIRNSNRASVVYASLFRQKQTVKEQTN